MLQAELTAALSGVDERLAAAAAEKAALQEALAAAEARASERAAAAEQLLGSVKGVLAATHHELVGMSSEQYKVGVGRRREGNQNHIASAHGCGKVINISCTFHAVVHQSMYHSTARRVLYADARPLGSPTLNCVLGSMRVALHPTITSLQAYSLTVC